MTEIPGYKSRVSKRGYRIVEIDYCADPKKDAAWLDKVRRSASSIANFNREVLRNWSITSGDTYFPEFQMIGRHRYEYDPPSLLKLPVLRGWDFGVRAPYVCWLQYSGISDRVYVLREWYPKGIAAHHFRDVARWLSGQLPIDELEPAARDWADLQLELAGVGQIPKPPWFPKDTEFLDFSGHEIDMSQSIAARDPREATLRGVWSAGGIDFQSQPGPVKARMDVLRRLLYLRHDGWPGIVISRYCPEVLAMLDGGLVYRPKTKARPKPEEPKKDGRFDNVVDGLTYPIIGVVPASPPNKDRTGWEQSDVGWTL